MLCRKRTSSSLEEGGSDYEKQLAPYLPTLISLAAVPHVVHAVPAVLYHHPAPCGCWLWVFSSGPLFAQAGLPTLLLLCHNQPFLCVPAAAPEAAS